MSLRAGQRAHITKAVNRFERAVEEYAFIGTIPVDCDAAIARREEIECEYERSRECLLAPIERYAS